MSPQVARAGVCLALLSLTVAAARPAQAFGGLWSSRVEGPVRPRAEQILFVDNPDSTITAVVRIEYEGPPQNFGWIVPVPSKPTVGVSSSTVFERLDAATSPQYWVEVAVDGRCAHTDHPDAEPAVPTLHAADRGSVGPYAYVDLSAEPGSPDAARTAVDWLTANGFVATDLDGARLGPYLKDGGHLVAFKLAAGANAGAIQPVTLTYQAASPTLPLRPMFAAAREPMAIHIWVVGPSQAVPRNYFSLVLDEARIDWRGGGQFLAGTLPAGGVGPSGPHVDEPSNYDVVVADAVSDVQGGGFVTELGAPVSQFREKVWSSLDQDRLETLTRATYADAVDAVVAAKASFGGWDGWREAVRGAVTLPAPNTSEEFASDPARFRGVAAVDAAKFWALLRQRVIQPVADTARLLYRAPYLTRLYAVMPAYDMVVDPTFDSNFDLAQVDGVHVAKQVIECTPARSQRDAPWRFLFPQGGAIEGSGRGAWPVSDATPANLLVVAMSTSGSGTVVRDNRDAIAGRLFAPPDAGADVVMPHPPRNGLPLGARPVVTPGKPLSAERGGAGSWGCGRCDVSPSGVGGPGPGFAWWLAPALWAIRRRRAAFAAVCALGLVACRSGAPPPADLDASALAGALSPEQLRDPEVCQDCHPDHYREWASSMHAYSAKDPVFVAMNKRGQRETKGALGEFCIRCHAPMAVADKRSRDGLSLDPEKERGVTCYFCHDAIGVEGDHNGMVRIANDTIMRGPIRDPRAPAAHRAEFAEAFEDTSPKSTAMCGGCHDIVTPRGVHLERTFQEYREGIFSKSATGAPPAFDSCVGCHMPGRRALIATVPGAPLRLAHEHLWPGIDLPLTDFPHADVLRSAVEECQLGKSVYFTLEATPPDLFSFQIETNAGHDQPSGAAQDRRMWLEVSGYDAEGRLLEGASSGRIADGEIEDRPLEDPKRDPRLLMLRDRIYDDQGRPAHMFWQAATSAAHPDGYESSVLPAASTTYVQGKHVVLKQYRLAGPDGAAPARVTAKLRIRPIGIDVLRDLVASGDLDPSLVGEMATLTFGSGIEWTPADGWMKTFAAETKADCSKYRCLFDPSSDECRRAPAPAEPRQY